ncbi:MAG: nucleotidyltransferase domain-containing protein, partial [Chloroflexota bacterium]
RGDWGVGSDLDLLVIVAHADEPFEVRGRAFSLKHLPVPADLLVYTLAEWNRLLTTSGFVQTIARDARWLIHRADEFAADSYA